MNRRKAAGAEQTDNHRRLLSVTLILIAVVFASEAARDFFNNEVILDLLNLLRLTTAVLAIISLATTIFWKLRFIPKNERFYLLTTSDSFANQALNRSVKFSWALTIFFLAFGPGLINKFNPDLPLEFYINLTLFVTFAVCGFSFFILFGITDKMDPEYSGQ
ncbi:MAG: hypothetical protein KDC80_02695 [Saprospiraceae bacterium]|nr:hypothetical protein [Saprospiraceae bacterium]